VSTPSEQLLAEARALEKSGRYEAAAKEFVRVGATSEAVRVLASSRNFSQAAWLLLSSQNIEITSVGGLSGDQRKAALNAAIMFARGPDTQHALTLFMALGETTRATELLRRMGASPSIAPGGTGAGVGSSGKNRAAYAAEQSGQWESAANLYLFAGEPYEAARCFLKTASLPQAFNALAKASRNDPRYRAMCVAAIRSASQAKLVEYQLEHFLNDFIQSVPRDRMEAEAFCLLAALYAEKGFKQNAKEVYGSVIAFDPKFQNVHERLLALEQAPELILSDRSAREDLANSPTRPLASARAERTPLSDPVVLKEGTVIAGRYRLQKRIGSGGMATVYRVMDSELQVEVALKAYQTTDAQEPMVLKRFRRELRLARSIVHPNVVRVFDIGLSGGTRYITMELLRGSDLSQLVKAGIQTPVLLNYLIQACAGLQATHNAGVVHRDIKPSNLFVTDDGIVKVMDFGIARAVNADTDITSGGMITGSPHYIAPEQIRHSDETTTAADIYSLGIVAYWALTGSFPFTHPEVIPLLMMHLEKDPAPLREFRPDLPEGLESAVMKCLAKAPEDRWPSCEALGAELARWAHEETGQSFVPFVRKDQ
jgi:serine/threonine-protein kinase